MKISWSALLSLILIMHMQTLAKTVKWCTQNTVSQTVPQSEISEDGHSECDPDDQSEEGRVSSIWTDEKAK